MLMGIKEIQEIIPHRHPFLLVDCIEELEPGVRAVGYKAVTYDEFFFRGHFPQEPVMLVSADVVRHGADGQGFRAKFCSDAVDTSRFHFHAEDAVFFHHVEHFAVRRVEQVSGEQVTNASIKIGRAHV